MLNELWFRREWIIAWVKWVIGIKMSDWNVFVLEIGS